MRSTGCGPKSARRGRGLLPPNPQQWRAEHNALDLRAELGITLDAPLPVESVFALLPNVRVCPHGALPAARRYLDHLRVRGRARWSGLAVRLPDASQLVLFNDAHSIRRTRATLMEEFFHIRLGHAPSLLRLLADRPGHRTFDSAVEREAFASGAAALAPYASLRAMLQHGVTVSAMSAHFVVSSQLIEYRLRVTRLVRRRR